MTPKKFAYVCVDERPDPPFRKIVLGFNLRMVDPLEEPMSRLRHVLKVSLELSVARPCRLVRVFHGCRTELVQKPVKTAFEHFRNAVRHVAQGGFPRERANDALQRQREPEFRPHPRLRRHGDVAAVELRDVLDNGEPEARPA